jgi:hypothetical protein
MKIINNPSQPGKALTGYILIILGTFLLADQLGARLPEWIISWPMLLITIGVISGVKHQFKRPGAFFMIFIGMVFLLDNYFLNVSFSIVWPALLIGAGSWLIIKRNRQQTYNETP